MRTLVVLAAAASLSLFNCAWAQDSDMETRMGSAQFRTAGLHKLDPDELRALEQWIAAQPPGQAQLRDAREAGRREAAVETARAPESEPVDSTIVGRFEGFARGRVFNLANGQVWRQVGDQNWPSVAVEGPRVEIRPARFGGWWMRVGDQNTRARVERVR
ncbi:hypothetical protein CNR27_05585 [Luteimonas chenhongjianii]|uniref:Secreted protein n=2 Tax=Lysobacteraceae TaxID=32033 RepID=A0A290XD08_9GAMM|nr:hypothetical protein CNR27_05585 [Luteimonas chenhongjianii]RPD84433.1 hypothetical protein EGK76_11910 [Luteimonas sp. 100069]